MFQECVKGVKKKISKVCQVSRGYHASFEGVLRRFKFFHDASRKLQRCLGKIQRSSVS